MDLVGKAHLCREPIEVARREHERRTLENEVDPPAIETPELRRAADEATRINMERIGASGKRGRPRKRTEEERKAYRAELMRKKRAEEKGS